ncbi:hypothetical protein [Prosthecodimorpha staleyi]|uniref:Uncharacterized protein n=1 Tax=Prosthecodimorpha staleyi TaxID=2840188 RepID=A0A947D104_9HYPH|nr:hypothetical protein [Prosthecodimorpha staleyi]MBT9288263.1 hypothetical protein [Prosthecodimorpha staleyi]
MIHRSVDQLIDNVLPAAADYFMAEQELSAVYAAATNDLSACGGEAAKAKRLAAQVAIAIDGLADRAGHALQLKPNAVRQQVGPLCSLGTAQRAGCIERVRAVADAYQHDHLSNPQHPITSNDDVLVVAPGFGIDGYGVGKWDGVEVLVHQINGELWKVLGDVPAAVHGWFHFFLIHGAKQTTSEISVCGLRVWP